MSEMTQIVLVLLILAGSILLLVTEWIQMEVTALLVLGALALTGLITPVDALAGFSNPAVVTIWAVFILSGGLQRTGVATIIGRYVLRLAGQSEARIITVIMLSAGVMSALMNNVAVAALMLPVTMDMARRIGTPPSLLLMPLAFGSLLGGLTTMIGTPPNILVSNIMRDAGLAHFRLFDYTPIGVVIMLAGTAFMAFVGRHLLPKRDIVRESQANAQTTLPDQYALQERLFVMRLRPGSALEGRTLADTRLGSLLGLNVMGIMRDGQTELAPAGSARLQGNDRLIVQGRLERLNDLAGWRELSVEEHWTGLDRFLGDDLVMAEVGIAAGSTLLGQTLREIGFGTRYGVHVLAIRRGGIIRRTYLQDDELMAEDMLLVHGKREKIEYLRALPEFADVPTGSAGDLAARYRLSERLFCMRVPAGCNLVGRTLQECRLGDALGMRVLHIIRSDGAQLMPHPSAPLTADDRLLVQGRTEDLDVVRALEGLEIVNESAIVPPALESERVGMMEAILSPRTTLAGKTLRQLRFRDKHGLTVLAIWRGGRSWRTGLGTMPLRLGDALLLYGPRERMRILGLDPDFVVLTQSAQEPVLLRKAPVAAAIMALVLVPVIAGVTPIYIAAVVGAAMMVLTRCMTMDDAYRQIEWKAIFLIAGMLPLGTALSQTGAAQLLAHNVVAIGQPFGPYGVMLGLLAITFLATSIVPTAALVVLMAPIILKTAADMQLSPQTLMMALAMSASSSFTSPVAHPANLMVMGPGGYRFRDYVITGVPLTLVVLVIIVMLTPLLHPFK